MYFELAEVRLASFQYDDRKLTWNYRDELVQDMMDVRSVERIYDCMKQHL